MPKNPQVVPFGYEPPKQERRGTLIFYDDFEHTTNEELESALQYGENHFFTKFVLYPLHEETVKRLSKKTVSAFYKREDRLHEWKREQGLSMVVVEGWDGKRKKYTPIEAALRHIIEKYPAPHFLYLTPETANLFASFASFEEWIVKIRLILSAEPERLHPKLTKFQHRWGLDTK
ncbi:hypothetical protein [Paenibacillus segetis]|uniref:Nicotinic acid mononucleotide adenylyltransferase n=1 Tax=Paenibacillus segetis TaxID=1325360 RepID=A0ABQ1YCI6_9BACL|nr:hypothetical protein [Paenibacillus segetis]GGH19515.1 hypothetical protein GCM10008013_16240 [Paenibacillus segetis]